LSRHFSNYLEKYVAGRISNQSNFACHAMSTPDLSPPRSAGWQWRHSYAKLPELFFTRVCPTPVTQPEFAIFNQPLAELLGLNAKALADPAAAKIFTGNLIADGADPLAQAYAGHQFGNFTGLGDGRAILLGEHLTPTGQLFDIQLKGSGRTPYSRGGDGRAGLGPMLREYIISEAMNALGIPTTRSLAVTLTGEDVFRQETLQGAILTRVAASHIRVGTFQWATAHEDLEALRALADYTITRHFPELTGTDSCYLKFYLAVMERQAALISKWLHVGFIHGVLNTDNMAISGETIDYGPCAFMDSYDPTTVFSSIDRQGRYSYGNQAAIARWNLARLGESLIPLLADDQATAIDLINEALATFEPIFQAHWLDGMRAKLGIFNVEDGDARLAQELLDWMHKNHQDFTLTFRKLSQETAIAEPIFVDADFMRWHSQWQLRLARQSASISDSSTAMRAKNPAMIPRNHLVENALRAATEQQDFSVMHDLLAALARPFDQGIPAEYLEPPPPSDKVYQTFCGT
jgi:serine/tyrosine/threonine adenylyltransferase